MALLLQPQKLKQLANKSNVGKKQLPTDDYRLLYRDFDVIQEFQSPLPNLDTIDDNCLIKFTKPMGNTDGDKIENGLIFVNSKNNRNVKIEDLINTYVNHPDIDTAMYDCIEFRYTKDDINDFTSQYKEEGHATWHIADKNKDNDEIKTKKINNESIADKKKYETISHS